MPPVVDAAEVVVVVVATRIGGPVDVVARGGAVVVEGWEVEVALGFPVDVHAEVPTARPPTATNPIMIRRVRVRTGMLLINRL
ncbi:MAG: hypothetical protein ACLPVF_01590 [Acidimicrobiales bacterium]